MAKIGVDVDGVLACFWPEYEQLHIQESGKDLFGQQRAIYGVHPACFDWPQAFGYTRDDTKAVWRVINRELNFWRDLSPLPEASEACAALSELDRRGHDVTFITARPGVAARRQTQDWLIRHGMERPTVIVAADKAEFVRLMALDAYIDDRLLNANDVMRDVRWRKSLTRVYLQEQRYNQRPIMNLDEPPPLSEWDEWRDPALIPVTGILEMLRKEGLN